MNRVVTTLLTLVLLGHVAAGEQSLETEPPLKERQRTQATLSGAQIKVYPLALRAGELITVIVERQGMIEPIVELFDPTGQRLVEYPADGKASGPMMARFTTQASGTFTLRIRARYLSDPPAGIALRLESAGRCRTFRSAGLEHGVRGTDARRPLR
jgi:hypothetical protein